MLSKKLFFATIGTLGLITVQPVVCAAQTVYEPGDISSILEDNSLRDTTTRYISVYSYFFPEEASRLGLTSVRNTLNDRSPETDAQALQALEAVRNSLLEITPQRLSEDKVAQYRLLQSALENNIGALEQNRLVHDPLYYAQALDAVYDLFLFPQNDERQTYTDLLGRLSALPKIAEQAKNNLTDTPPFRSRLAMEKAYYAYLSFDEISKRISSASFSNDPRDTEQANTRVRQAKTAVKAMFDLFKTLSQQDEWAQDFRMGTDAYTAHLKRYYHIADKPELLSKRLARHFESVQKDLWTALQPFELSADTEEVTVVENLNEPPQSETYADPQQKAKQKNNKKQKPVYTSPTANQFYALASQLQSPFSTDKLLEDILKQANTWSTQLVRSKVIPAPMSFALQPLPKYFAYQQLSVKIPAIRALFLRIPQGNKSAQKEALNRDYNDPESRLLVSREIVPGRFYQTYSTPSLLQRVLGSPTLGNGWEEYALQTAQEQGYFLTDEERLFVAWHNYRRALLALLDQRLHTQRDTYESALQFLTEDQGFTQEQAAAILNEIIRSPGEAVSYVIGGQLWQKAAAPYQKKWKNIGKVNALLLQAGNVLPEDLPGELKRLSQKK